MTKNIGPRRQSWVEHPDHSGNPPGLRARVRSIWRFGVPDARHAAPKRFRDRLKSAAAALGIASLMAGAGVALSMNAAQAADLAYGFESSDGRIGTVWVNGIPVVCIDPFGGSSDGVPSNMTPSYGTAGMSAQNAAALNMVMSTFATQADNVTGAAVELAAWTLKGIIVDYAQSTGYGGSDARGAAEWFSVRAGGSAGAVMGKYDEIMAAAAGVTVAQPGNGSGQLTFQVDPTNNYLGTLTVSNLSPADAVGTLTLTNGVFTDTGTATSAGVHNGMVLNVKGVPPEDTVDYKISAVGQFTGTGNGWAGEIAVYDNPVQQMAGPGRAVVANFELRAEDPTTRSTVFQPIVGTRVASEFVEKGDLPQDVLVFSTAADEDGVNNPWRQALSGAYFPITAKGILYGPFTQQPGEADTAPAGAPIAARATVTTTPEAGPTIEYTATADTPVDESGFYTWVWSIDRADQLTERPNVQLFLSDGYLFTDRFGQVVETHVVASDITFGTQLDSTEEVIGGEIVDTITPTLVGGAWLRVDGQRVPVTLTGTAYYSETEPERAATAPEGAEVVSTHTATLTGPQATTTDPITMPYRTGYLTIQWCIDPAAQPAEYQGLVNAFCDDYGVPSETVKLVGPTITTQAQETAVPGGTVHDVAIVEGPVPPAGVEITFEGYLQPEDATEPVCTPDTAIYTSTEPVLVDEAGEYPSEDFDVLEEHLGTVYWIETAKIPGTDIVIATGECGEPTETTTVRYPTVSTKAVAEVNLGEPAHDVAIVDGATVPGSYVTFTAYLQPEGSKAPVCTPQNAVPASTKLPKVTVDGEGEYPSADVVFDKVGTYFWVEELHTPDDKVVHTGECGAPGETTVVKALPVGLAHTGFSGAFPLMIAGGLLLSGALVIVVLQIRRRRSVNAE